MHLARAVNPRRPARFLLAAMVLAGGSALAFAQPAAPRPASGESLKPPTNAALRHYRAWGTTSAEALKAFSDAWAEASALTPGWQPTPALRQSLVPLNDYIQTTLRAAALDTADWGIEYADGWKATLPHLGKLREASRVLEAHARLLLAQAPAQREEAIAALGAIFRLSAHLRQDRTLISTLVAAAITSRGAAVVGALLDQGALTGADAKPLLAALECLPPGDSFNLAGSLLAERLIGRSLFEQTGPNAGPKAAAAARQLVALNSDADPAGRNATLVARLEAMDEAALATDLGLQTNYYAQVESAIRAGVSGPGEATKARLADLEARATKGDFGIIMQIAGAAFSRAYDSDMKARASLEALRSRLAAAK